MIWCDIHFDCKNEISLVVPWVMRFTNPKWQTKRGQALKPDSPGTMQETL